MKPECLLLLVYLCYAVLNIGVYELDHSDQSVILQLDQPVQIDSTLALCYRYQDTWVQGDYWNFELVDGGYIRYPDFVIENRKMIKALWNFNEITTFLVNVDSPDYFQLRWNNVCYMIDFTKKIVRFYHNGKLVVQGSPDGLKNSNDNVIIKEVVIMKDRKAKVTDINLITKGVTEDLLQSFTSCQSSAIEGPYSWESGLWQLIDSNKTEISQTTEEEIFDSFCRQESLRLILPMQHIWRGKEKCNLLSGRLYNYRNVTERNKFQSWVKSWHEKIGEKIPPGRSIT